MKPPSANEIRQAVDKAARSHRHEPGVRIAIAATQNLCRAVKLVDENGTRIEFIQPDLPEATLRIVAKQLDTLSTESRNKAIDTLAQIPQLKALANIAAEAIKLTEDVINMEEHEKKQENLRKEVFLRLRKEKKAPYRVLRVMRLYFTICTFTRTTSGAVTFKKTGSFSEAQQRELTFAFKDFGWEDINQIEYVLDCGLQDLRSMFLEAREAKLAKPVTLRPQPVDVDRKILLDALPRTPENRMCMEVVMRTLRQADHPATQAMHALIRSRNNIPSLSGSSEEAAKELRELRMEFLDVEPLLADIQKAMHDVSLAYFEAWRDLPWFPRDAADPRADEAANATEAEAAAYQLFYMSHVLWHAWAEAERQEGVNPDVIMRTASALVRKSVMMSLFLSSARKRFPHLFVFTPAEQKHPLEQKRALLAQKTRSLSALFDPVSRYQVPEGTSMYGKESCADICNSRDELTDSWAHFIRAHAWGMHHPPGDSARIGRGLPSFNEAPAGRCTQIQQLEKYDGCKDTSIATTAIDNRTFGSPDVHRSLWHDDHFEDQPLQAWMWRPGDPPCHSPCTLLPLAEILPADCVAVQKLQWMAAQAENDLCNWYKYCDQLGLKTEFPALRQLEITPHLLELLVQNTHGASAHKAICMPCEAKEASLMGINCKSKENPQWNKFLGPLKKKDIPLPQINPIFVDVKHDPFFSEAKNDTPAMVVEYDQKALKLLGKIPESAEIRKTIERHAAEPDPLRAATALVAHDGWYRYRHDVYRIVFRIERGTPSKIRILYIGLRDRVYDELKRMNSK